MKNIRISFYFLAAIVLATLLCTSCEISSSSGAIKIEPSSASLYKGQSVTLTAYGGFTYTWSLNNDDYGVLSTRQGIQTVYTSIFEPPTNTAVSQIVTVHSTIEDSGGGSGSNATSTASSQSAETYITHLPPR